MTTKNEIVNYKEEMARQAERARLVEAPTVNRISFKAGQISLDNQVIGTSMVCFILANRRVNSWFPSQYVAGSMDAPHCWSIFNKEDEAYAEPDERCVSPQAERCVECPKNAFGSAANRKAKACGNRRRIALIPAGRELPDGSIEYMNAASIRSFPIYYSVIPPTSDKVFSTYCYRLADAKGYNSPCWGVVTKISTAPDPKTVFKVSFDFAGILEDEEAMAEVFKKVELAERDIEFGFEVAQVTPNAQQGTAATGKF